MATRTETNVVYVAGLVQGIVLVTFPAASTIFTDPDEYDLIDHAVRRDVPAPGGHRDRRRRCSAPALAQPVRRQARATSPG